MDGEKRRAISLRFEHPRHQNTQAMQLRASESNGEQPAEESPEKKT